MAVTSSAPISITDLVTEFGGSAPHAITEYYRGGSLVPNTTANNSIPTSGAISLTNFFGASASSSSGDRTLTIGTYRGIFGEDYFGFLSTSYGAISSNTIEFTGFNVTVTMLNWTNLASRNELRFRVSGNVGNSGWTSITVGSTTLNRTDAAYSTGSVTDWTWGSIANPIGTSGTQTVSWTE